MRQFFVVLLLVVFGSQSIQAQFFKKNLYYEGELGGVTALAVTDSDGETKFFSITGINFRGGVGVHNEEGSLFFGLHTGMDGIFRHKTGILPIYLNSKVAFDAGEGKLVLSFGYGKSFQVGPENYKGYLKKYTIAYATVDDENRMQSFFIEINNHGFNFPDGVSAITLNLGFTFTFL